MLYRQNLTPVSLTIYVYLYQGSVLYYIPLPDEVEISDISVNMLDSLPLSWMLI